MNIYNINENNMDVDSESSDIVDLYFYNDETDFQNRKYRFYFKKNLYSNDTCSICFENNCNYLEFNTDTSNRTDNILFDTHSVITLCNHSFHKHCIDTWLYKSNNCPICRYEPQNNSKIFG